MPLVNPLRTAEELSVLDAMTNGKLLVGLFRGTPNEYLTYGTNPAETREVFEEAVSLILEAWTQPEPISWVGRHYDLRVVAVWPRPVSVPHPPILVSANSPTSATYAAENHFKVGVAFAGVDRTAEMMEFSRPGAQAAAAAINAAGGIDGRNVVIDVCDNKGDPNVSAQCARVAKNNGDIAVVATFDPWERATYSPSSSP